MKYEVEMKFRMADTKRLEQRLAALGSSVSEARLEVDVYFAHPSRNFRETDEALRIRRKGETNFVTYKGPKIDPTTKTRREIDLPLLSGGESADAWTELLKALGFSAAGVVTKSRRKTHVVWQDRHVEASLDDVQGLGEFAELELVVAAEELEAAKACITSLAQHLGLEQSERRSYLELLDQGRTGQGEA